MKKIAYFLIALSFVALSCNKILDVEPTDAISSEEALKDRDGIEKAITGAYNSLHDVGNYGRNRILADDLAADNLSWTGTTRDYQQVDQNLIAADNGITEGLWASGYDCINRVNNVLAVIGSIDMTEVDRNTFTGDALFLRALSHFNLLTYFGGVPIKTKPTTDLSSINQARNTPAEVYEQVINDLVQAETLLPASREEGWASSFSATALLARVYLTRYHAESDPAYATLAIEKASKVISEGGFALAPAFEDLFAGNQTEAIFDVVFDAQNYNRLAQYCFPVSLTGRYETSPTPAFVTEFQPSDTVRFNTSIRFDEKMLPYAYKYRDIVAGTDRVLVLRLAEMYLIRAEARAWTNGNPADIQADLNMIRTRAGLEPTVAATQDELKLAVMNERRHEFAFEGQRWSDLVRVGWAAALLGIDSKFTLFPIPLSEMQTNSLMTQNPGY